MGIAISALHGMFTPLAVLFTWLAGEDSRQKAAARSTAARRPAPAPISRPACTRLARPASTVPATQGQPLRVLRVAEPGSPASGRLVISGRLADVCAELDRLAAMEAARR